MTSKKNWRWIAIALLAGLCFCLSACGAETKSTNVSPKNKTSLISEVSPPPAIAKLAKLFDQFNPTVQIVSPQPDQVLLENKVSVKIKVKDLPIFKSAEFSLGPHVHVALDGQEYKALYDTEQALTFENLAPGTHTLRAFASRPWHESFKNKSAYAQVTFHVLTPTLENLPQPDLPLLTYSRPVGNYGAEPVMLDFYIHNPALAQADLDSIPEWKVRVTVNDEAFITDQWQPIYLKGLNTGRNWVKLELIDSKGLLIPNAYSSTAHLFNYQPNGSDTLSRLARGEEIANIQAIADPNYVPPAPPTPPVLETTPQPITQQSPAPASPTATPTAQPTEKATEKPLEKTPEKPKRIRLRVKKTNLPETASTP